MEDDDEDPPMMQQAAVAGPTVNAQFLQQLSSFAQPPRSQMHGLGNFPTGADLPGPALIEEPEPAAAGMGYVMPYAQPQQPQQQVQQQGGQPALQNLLQGFGAFLAGQGQGRGQQQQQQRVGRGSSGGGGFF